MTNSRLDQCIREYYLELLDDFQKEKIQIFKFSISIENAGKLTSDIINTIESNLIILPPTQKSLDFSNLLEEVFEICEGYLRDVELYDQNSEVEFKNWTNETYFEIKNFLNEE